jgi:parvulin-like peptidyl-prolyl isomerase
MRFPRVARIGFAGALVAASAVLGAAYAQDASKGGAAGDTAVGMKRDVKLAPDEQLRAADGVLTRIDAAANQIRRQLEQARAQRDVVKSLCLNDKLTQVDVAARSGRDRREGLRQAVARQDSELSNHEYTIIMVLKDRVDALTAEANQCIGEEAGFVGETRVTVSIDPNLPKDDPAQYPESPVIVVPPSCVSCYK